MGKRLFAPTVEQLVRGVFSRLEISQPTPSPHHSITPSPHHSITPSPPLPTPLPPPLKCLYAI
ncbi:MAG: hypothetical protein EA368_15340 [Leptolyngbya sp. DLM2.Bin27]|nr:MAG: hypothetical protein EA368_15340 [Leptolyngbya sp. DLM2.Bin27]